MRRLLTVLLLATSSACAQQHINRGEAERPTYVALGFQAPDTCSITVGGETFVLSKDQDAAIATLKRELVIHPHALLVADQSIPYKCMGGAIVEAQRAGFKKVAFITMQPPTGGSK
jgi:biopolymer transport protein ExbD